MAHCEQLWRAADDTGGEGAAVVSTKRRKRSWEEASDDEDQDPEAAEAARKEAEMEADRSTLVILFALGLQQEHKGGCGATQSCNNHQVAIWL